jgi:hypothetical protein
MEGGLVEDGLKAERGEGGVVSGYRVCRATTRLLATTI